MFKNPFRTWKSYKRPTVVKNIYFSLFTSLQSNSDPFVLQSSGDECDQSSGPNQLSFGSGKSRPLCPSFKLHFYVFNHCLRSFREWFSNFRAPRLARVPGMDPYQSALFYAKVTLVGATISQTITPTAQHKIGLNFLKFEPMKHNFEYPRRFYNVPMFDWCRYPAKRMVIEWKEREHSEEDELVMGNKHCMNALRNCGLKKFFLTPCLRAQPELLQYLISIWDEDEEKFKLRDQELEL